MRSHRTQFFIQSFHMLIFYLAIQLDFLLLKCFGNNFKKYFAWILLHLFLFLLRSIYLPLVRFWCTDVSCQWGHILFFLLFPIWDVFETFALSLSFVDCLNITYCALQWACRKKTCHILHNMAGKMSGSFCVLHHLEKLNREDDGSYSFLLWSTFVPISVSGRIFLISEQPTPTMNVQKEAFKSSK